MIMNVTFFSPFSVVMDWKSQELVIQKFLKKNYQINIIGCDGLLKKSCPAIDAIDFNKKIKNSNDRICYRCRSNKRYFNNSLKINYFNIEEFIDENSIKKIEKIISKTDKKNIINFSERNLKIGKYASYEIISKYKKNDTNFTTLEFEDFLLNFENCLKIYYGLENYSKKFKTDFGIAYNGSYGVCNLFLEYFKQKGSKSYLIHGSNNNFERFEKINFYKDNNIVTLNKIKNNFQQFEKNPINKKDIEDITKHIKTLIYASSSHTYSASIKKNFVDINKFFNIDSNKKIILAAMSSYDEILTSKLLGLDEFDKSLFPNQIEWIKSLIEYFKYKKQFHLIIRPHPREFNNKIESQQMNELKKLTFNLPDNINVNYPDQNISVFNYIKSLHMLLNGWSSIGEDLGYFGIPSISISSFNICYPENLSYVAKSKKDYFEIIEKMENSKKEKLETSIKFFRYKSFVFNKTTLDLSLSLPKKDSFFSLILRAIDKMTLSLKIPSLYKFYVMKNIQNFYNIKGLENILNSGSSNLSETLNPHKIFDNKFYELEKENIKLSIKMLTRFLN